MSDAGSNTGASGGDLLARVAPVARLIELTTAAGLPLDGAYLVGGAVRDALLDVPATFDLDIAVEGSGVSFANLLASATGGDVLAEHPFGTARIVAPLGPDGAPVRVDVASCRTETYAEPGALPTVSLDAAIDADLVRRDVTANAVAIALEPGPDGTHAIVDPHGGIADIEARVLRVLHDESLRDDPTRIFRIARYAGRLGFRVGDHARRLATEAVAAGALATVSAERVRTELQLVLGEPAWASLTLLASWGVAEQLESRLEAAFHPPLVLRAIDAACGADHGLNQRAWTLRLAALARGLGDDVAGWMRWLGFPGDVIGPVSEHVHVLGVMLDPETGGSALLAEPNSELYFRLGELDDESFALAALVAGDDVALAERIVDYRAALRTTRLTVRGDDVVAAGVPVGPAVGRILGNLFLRSLDGELGSEAAERAALAELAAQARAPEGDTPT